MNRGLSTDLHFVGGAIHLVGVNLHHRDGGYDLYVSRGFAVTIWEFLTETAAQWGYEIDEMESWGP